MTLLSVPLVEIALSPSLEYVHYMYESSEFLIKKLYQCTHTRTPSPKHTNTRTHTCTRTHTYIYMYIYIYVLYVCMYMYNEHHVSSAYMYVFDFFSWMMAFDGRTILF